MKRVLFAGRAGCWAVIAIVAVAGAACSKETSGSPPATAADDPLASTPASPPAAPGATAAAESVAAATVPTAATAPQVVEPSQLPDVVARIDGEAISKSDLVARASEARGMLAQRGGGPPPPTRAFWRMVLDDIIGNRLLYRDLKASSKVATPEQVEQRMQLIRGQFPSQAEFEQAISARGFDLQRFEGEVAESVTVQNWIGNEVAPTIAVSDAEARGYFDSHPDQMLEPERVHARHILIRVAPQASEADRSAARQKIEEIRQRIAAGGDFAAIARETSEDKTSAERGGDLGWFYRGQMVPAFEKAAFGTPLNQLSDIVETRFGFHLIETLEQQAERKVGFEEVKDRLLAMLKQQKLEAQIKQRVNELARQAKIEILI